MGTAAVSGMISPGLITFAIFGYAFFLESTGTAGAANAAILRHGKLARCDDATANSHSCLDLRKAGFSEPCPMEYVRKHFGATVLLIGPFTRPLKGVRVFSLP